MSPLGQTLPGRAASKPDQVRYAPKAPRSGPLKCDKVPFWKFSPDIVLLLGACRLFGWTRTRR